MGALLNNIYNTILYIVYILLITVIILLIPTASVFATSSESEFFDEDGNVLYTDNRPAINEDFAPDYSCLFDAFQLKCVPGSAQECPRPEFGNNEDNTCWSKTFINGEWVRNCPDGYHTTDGDETGQCYPNDEECPNHFFLVPDPDPEDDGDRCARPAYYCPEHPDHPKCEDFIENRTD